jgi:hypothetical protein
MGHALGECYFDSIQDLTYIHIPKNASSFAKRITENFEYSKTFRNASNYLILLRDPIDRWVSGMSQLIQSDPITDWTDEYIFEHITLNDHTEKQIYFLEYLNFEKDLDKCIFFKVDENLSDKFIGWANVLYPNISIHKTKLNTSQDVKGRIEIIKNLQTTVDNSPDLVLKLKKHFESDYELINRVKFYGT